MRALLILLLFAASAGEPQTFDLSEGTLSYTVVHKLHEVEGTTHTLEGRAMVQLGGTLRVQIRAKVASFDSGNSNRDEHMREVTHEPAHPYVQIKGTAAGVRLPISAPIDLTLDGIIEFNGVQHAQRIPVHLEPQPQRGVRVRFSFPVSFEVFQVERPELLLVKVDDAMIISGELLFAEAAK